MKGAKDKAITVKGLDSNGNRISSQKFETENRWGLARFHGCRPGKDYCSLTFYPPGFPPSVSLLLSLRGTLFLAGDKKRGSTLPLFECRLTQARFFVVLGGAVMQRGRQAVFDHLVFFQDSERRMQLLE